MCILLNSSDVWGQSKNDFPKEIHVKSLDLWMLACLEKGSLQVWLNYGFWDCLGLPEWALISMISVFFRARQRHTWDRRKDRYGGRGRWCEDRAEGCVATSQGMPTTPEAGTSNKRFFSRSFGGSMALLTPWSQIFYPMELWKNTLLLFEADKFVVICYCSQGS